MTQSAFGCLQRREGVIALPMPAGEGCRPGLTRGGGGWCVGQEGGGERKMCVYVMLKMCVCGPSESEVCG